MSWFVLTPDLGTTLRHWHHFPIAYVQFGHCGGDPFTRRSKEIDQYSEGYGQISLMEHAAIVDSWIRDLAMPSDKTDVPLDKRRVRFDSTPDGIHELTQISEGSKAPLNHPHPRQADDIGVRLANGPAKTVDPMQVSLCPESPHHPIFSGCIWCSGISSIPPHPRRAGMRITGHVPGLGGSYAQGNMARRSTVVK